MGTRIVFWQSSGIIWKPEQNSEKKPVEDAMKDELHDGYDQVQARLRYGVTLAYGIDNHEVGQGIIDLCRVAWKEITIFGLRHGSLETPSYERLLLETLIPEMARRLIMERDAMLLPTREEHAAVDISGISGDELRRNVAICYRAGNFDVISGKIRAGFDPDYSHSNKSNTFLAIEMISRDVRAGNIIEIALNRIAPVLAEDPPESDWMACSIQEWARQCGLDGNHVTWSPDLPEYNGGPEPHERIVLTRLPSGYDLAAGSSL